MWSWICLRRRPISSGRSDRGVALPGAVLFAAFLAGLTGWLVGHVVTDEAMTRDVEDAAAAARVADAAVEIAAHALGQAADWSNVGALALPLACPPAATAVTPLDEGAERAWIQAETDAAGRWSAAAPQWVWLWTCHGAGVLHRWPARGLAPSVVVWVADDPEGDGQPLASANGTLLLAAVAVARDGTRVATRAAIARSAPGESVRILSWHGAGGG